jgi:hypothetical protein
MQFRIHGVVTSRRLHDDRRSVPEIPASSSRRRRVQSSAERDVDSRGATYAGLVSTIWAIHGGSARYPRRPTVASQETRALSP